MLGFPRPARKISRPGAAQTAAAAAAHRGTPAPVPVRQETRQDRGRNVYFSKGQYLARQDRWDTLARLIAETDRNRAATLSGVSMAALLADGARSDAVRHARGEIADGADGVPSGILALEDIAGDHADHWGVALVVARAQIDCAWAYEGQVDPFALPDRPSDAFITRFAAAADLIAAAETRAPDSAEIAAIRCDLLAADPAGHGKVEALHAASISSDPANPGRLRAYGVHLLPRWFGTLDQLDVASRCLSADLRDHWGDGAYTWMWFDALRLDPAAAEYLEPGRFIAGMHAILTKRPDPHLANLMCAYAEGMAPDTAPDDLSDSAMRTRSLIHDALPDLAERHLTELHPQVWARADALPGASHPGPLSLGRIQAATAQAKAAVETALTARMRAAGTVGHAAG